MEKFTNRELQCFKFLHNFRTEVRGGEIRVIFHEHDIVNIIVQGKVIFDGKGEELDKMKMILTSLFQGDIIRSE